MPYTGAGDDKLPQNVKNLSESKRAQWVAVFNSAYDRCEKGGGEDCEKSAFAQAWGVVNKTQSKIQQVLNAIKDLLVGEQKSRSLSLPAIYDQTYLLLCQQDPLAMLFDLYYDDGGLLFAICNASGKLYRIPLDVGDGIVTLGEWQEIVIEQSRRSSYRIIRNAQGRYRWFTISGSTVLNRSGEIDSRQLFDNMIKRAEKTGKYPIRIFYHTNQKFRVGICDYLARDGNVLITSGLYDQTELAQREIAARQKNPEKWGDSIGFTPLAPAQMMRVADGIEIPVYIDGFLDEISTLPETDAAAWFTGAAHIQEVTRMLQKRQMDALVTLFDGDEAAAKKWLAENAEERNRQIADASMITRAQDDLEPVTQADPPAQAPAPTAEAPTDEPPAPAEEPTQEPEGTGKPMGEIELDEAAIMAIADAVAKNIDVKALADQVQKAIKTDLDALVARVDELEKELKATSEAATAATEAAGAVAQAINKTDEAKKREWMNDLPAGQTARVTYRPRSQNAAQPLTGNEIAEQALSKIPAKSRY